MNLAIKNEKELEEKYTGVDVNKIIQQWIQYYNKKPFYEERKRVWLENVKDFLILENLDYKENPQQSSYDEDVKWEFVELISGKNKEWGKATELLRNYVLSKLNIYTIKNDNKPEIWVYKKGIYEPNGKSEIRKLLRELLGSFYTHFIFGKVIEKIEPDTFVEQKNFFGNVYINEIPVENGILDIFTRELKPFTPDKIFFNKMPVEYNPEATCPKIDNFLSEVLACSEDKQVFYEMAGFCLLKEYRFEKAFILVGDGRNGKDKSLELLKRTLGIENCCNVPLSSLVPDSFVISEFFGKIANISGDIGNEDLKDTSMFKALTGRSLVSGQRKFLNQITFVNFAKFIFACNDLPFAYDNSRGFWDRWVLLEYPYSFVKQEEIEKNPENKNLKLRDENIIEKITTKEELSGFLNKILKGLDNLIKNKDFSLTKGTEEIKNYWVRKSNSVMAFCLDKIEESYDGYITKKMFRKRYIKYCKKHKINIKTDYVIKRTLAEMFGALDGTKYINDKNEYIWDGIQWKNQI